MFKRIRVSRNFYLDEFVDPYTYFNKSDHGLSMVDPRLFKIAQLIRNLYGSGIRINSWWWYYEKYKLEYSVKKIIYNIEHSKTISRWSGIRTNRTKIGAGRSAHRLMHTGKGLGMDIKGNSKVFFKIVKKHAKRFYDLGLRRLEDISITPSWLHMDLLKRNTKPNSIRVVDRTKSTETIRW